MNNNTVVNNTITRELANLAAPTGNIYESAVIMAKRANQIAADLKSELSKKLEEFSNYADTLEETFENREQIEISKYYEKLPKPTLTAVKEFEEGKIFYRKAE
ncbi:MAG: DNA-directed RNA polymerase subunit omega [Bacteroidales bacterium]|nr:DNA-directed RNA polymerase subunit omega [Bacteroidales bacterium]